jgi:hypothetical protein
MIWVEAADHYSSVMISQDKFLTIFLPDRLSGRAPFQRKKGRGIAKKVRPLI